MALEEPDALRLLRLVEQPVPLCLGERAWNGLAGDRLELPHDASRSGPRTEDAKELSERIVHLVDHPFFQRDDRVVGDVDLFRTDPGAALGDVAVPDAMQLLELPGPLFDVERVHLQRRDVGDDARADGRLGRLVLTDPVAQLLAEEASHALAGVLHALD